METDENTAIWKTPQITGENIETNQEGFRRFIPSKTAAHAKYTARQSVPVKHSVKHPVVPPHVAPKAPPPQPPKESLPMPLPKINPSVSSPDQYKPKSYSVPSSSSPATQSSKLKQDTTTSTSPPTTTTKNIQPPKSLPQRASFGIKTGGIGATQNEGLDTLHIRDPPYVDRHEFIPKIVALDSATQETKLYKKEDPSPEPAIRPRASENPFLEKIIETTPQDYTTEDNNIKERLQKLIFGVDYSNFDMVQFRNLISSIFNFFPELVDIALYAVSYKIVRLFYSSDTIFTEKHSSPNKYEEDIRTVKLQLYAFLAIPFSYLVGYNLWYLFTTVYPYKKIGDIVDSNSILKYVFETSFAPTVALNYALFGYKQGEGKMWTDAAYSAVKPVLCIVAVLFFILVYFYVKNNTAGIRNLFNSIIKNPTTTKDPMYSIFFTVVMIAFLGINVFYMKEEAPFMSMMLGFVSPLTAIILLIIKMVVVLLTVPIGMLVLIIYLVLFSTMGIAFYNGFTNIFATIKAIDVEIKNSVPKPQGSCTEEGIFTKILRWINTHIYDYLTFFILALVFISNLSSVFTGLHSLKLKTMMTGVYVIMMVIVACIMIWKIYKNNGISGEA